MYITIFNTLYLNSVQLCSKCSLKHFLETILPHSPTLFHLTRLHTSCPISTASCLIALLTLFVITPLLYSNW